VKGILSAVENFHFVFTAVTSQRSSGGISLMYASAAKNLHEATSLSDKVSALDALEKKFKTKIPGYAEFEARFVELRYSSKFTKQKNLVRYTLSKICQRNSSGTPLDPDKLTIEHIAPENPAKVGGLTDEEIASIGNLIVVDQALNNKLANKSFLDKKKILGSANIWVDPAILNATSWGSSEIESRARSLASEAYNKVWKL
jgi:hypothetical protein